MTKSEMSAEEMAATIDLFLDAAFAKGRQSGLEDGAKVAEEMFKPRSWNDGGGKADALNIAAAIRSLKDKER